MSKIFGLFGKAIPYAQPNTGVHEMVMKRLRKTYKDSGGSEREEDNELEGLSRFDALKILLSRKLEATRTHVKKIDDLTGHAQIMKKQTVRRMLVNVKGDFQKLEVEFDRTVRPPRKLLTKAEPDPVMIEARREDVELIGKHIKEVELLYKARFRSDMDNARDSYGTGGGNSEAIRDLTGASDSEEDEQEAGWMDHVALPTDPEASNLPAIDISQAMLKVKRNRRQMVQGLEQFNNKLDLLAEQARDMTGLIEEGGELAEEVRVKIEDETENLKKVTTKVEKATKGVNTQTKLLLIVIVMICIIFAAIIIYIVLLATGLVPGGFRFV